MAILSNSSFHTILIIVALYSMCQLIQVIESRFLWDLSLYCINYCSRNNDQMLPIHVCSCHRIASYHRRMTNNNIQSEIKQDYQFKNYQQPINNQFP
ncbi:unnamed protein product [Rotaria socialis]|uniref:Transmembrane protein n=1 Tax=Rotaria socialis TaxID=392032 RepID=A0A819AMN1_9BILA|nr:unnamed protein product [Rotaria socialis]CAF3184904.1 unnamed protein product [Rotaria socialis]CAF3315718.1 unnamed protein product [Rotaria socialis]CAF3787007.1 unnamed protein product [Rotaria socialis]CAF4389703.1 unnamed protein product [Rotaria socialis]